MPLLAPAQPRAWAMASLKSQRWSGLAAVLLLVLAGLTAWIGGGLVMGFVTLGALLLGAALLLPAVLIAGLKLGARTARSAMAEWVWADMRQQVPGLSLALMALMLALATTIGVSTMSFLAAEYLRGDTVDANTSLAAHWMEQSRASGNPYGIFALGYYTEINRFEKRSTADSRALALKHYLQAAKLGDIDAMSGFDVRLADAHRSRALVFFATLTMTTSAITLGVTRKSTGLKPSVVSASTSSLTFIVPISAA